MGLAKLDPPYILTWRRRLTRRAVTVHLYIMLPEIPADEFAAALDACVDSILWETGVERPPVDALVVAGRLGMVVAQDCSLAGRARIAQLADADGRGGGQATIVVGLAERPEREQWAVAHEIGESIAYRVFDTSRRAAGIGAADGARVGGQSPRELPAVAAAVVCRRWSGVRLGPVRTETPLFNGQP